MADTSHSLLFLSQREVIEAGVLNMEQVVPLMEKVYGLHWRGETRASEQGGHPLGRRGNGMGKGPHQRLARLDRRGHPHWGHQVDRRLPRRRPRAGYAQSGGAGDHQRPVTLYPVAIMDGVLLSAIPHRGQHGGGGLHLAKEDTRTIAIVGGGFQGRTQLMALLVARPQTREIRIYDVNRAQAENFARHMEKRTGRKVAVCATVDETVKGADIVVTATGSTEPLLLRRHLEPGMLYIHVGGNECEYEVISAADQAVCRRLGTDQAPRRVEPRAHVFRREAQG